MQLASRRKAALDYMSKTHVWMDMMLGAPKV